MLNHRSHGVPAATSFPAASKPCVKILLCLENPLPTRRWTTPASRAMPRSGMSEDTFDSLSEQASALAAQGLSAARHSGRDVSQHAVDAFEQAATAARRHPLPFALAVVGVGLATALLVNMMARNDSPRKRLSRSSLNEIVRRPLAKVVR